MFYVCFFDSPHFGAGLLSSSSCSSSEDINFISNLRSCFTTLIIRSRFSLSSIPAATESWNPCSCNTECDNDNTIFLSWSVRCTCAIASSIDGNADVDTSVEGTCSDANQCLAWQSRVACDEYDAGKWSAVA